MRTRFVLATTTLTGLGVAALIALGGPAPSAPPAPAPQPEAPRSQAVVGLGSATAEQVAQAVDGQVIRRFAPLGVVVIEAPGQARALTNQLAALPGVDFAEVNRSAICTAGRGRCSCQAPPKFSPPALEVYGLERVADHLRLEEAWLEAEAKGEGILVGLVDTGVDPEHAALRGALAAGIDLVDEGGEAADSHGHGTAMAAIIAGRGDGKSGFLGVAPHAKILPVRVADERGTAPMDLVAKGIVTAVDRGARVIYVGLAVRGRSPTLAKAIAYAREAGSLVFCPSGNDSLDTLRSPAAEDGAVAVGGIAGHDNLALGANISPHVLLAAPSEFVPAPLAGQVRYTEGTSASAALAAGVAALTLSRWPELDDEALLRTLLAGSQGLPAVDGSVLADRLQVRSLDAAGAAARAVPDHAEVVVKSIQVSPRAPVAGTPAQIRLQLVNAGHRPLARVELGLDLAGASLELDGLTDLAPGESRWVETPWTPTAEQAGQLELNAWARAIPTAREGVADAVVPTVGRRHQWLEILSEARPDLAVSAITLTQPMTLDKPVAVWEITLVNQGSATGRGMFHAAIDGEVREPLRVVLAPGESQTRTVSWSAPGDMPPSMPVFLEAYLECKQDWWVDNDLHSMRVALQDTSLPLDPQYRQVGDVDIAVDVPWRLAGDRTHAPFLLFVPSIGRPSRYSTFHETLALRRGVVARARGGSAARRNVSRARSAVGGLVTYTTAMFIKEMAQAAQSGDDEAIRRFFDKMLTVDFGIDYGLYATGAWAGAKGWSMVEGRAATIKGLRWTGGNLGNRIARTQAAVMLGYLLPNLARGRLDRRVAIDLFSLGVTTAAVESLAHLVSTNATKGAVGARLTALLKRYGRVAKAGGWVAEVGKLVIILYASEWISNSIDKPIVKFQAKRALGNSYEALGAALKADDETFAAATREFEDAFDAYRNDLNQDLADTARDMHKVELSRKQTENIPPALKASRERVLQQQLSDADTTMGDALQRFEQAFERALQALYDPNASASLTDPGESKVAVFDLELELLRELAGRAEGARKELLEAKLATTLRLRNLDIDLTLALMEGAGASGAPIRPEQVEATDGLLLKKVTIKARDSFHEMTDNAEAIEARSNQYAPLGSVEEQTIYEHDVSRERYYAAPGIVRLNENGEPQEHVALLDAPRPLTMKGRYNMLRLPRRLLEPFAKKSGKVYLHVKVDWELQKVVSGALVRPAQGSYEQMLAIQMGEGGLPEIKGLKGGYLDAHYHTIAEWYNPEPGFVADLELDAPRQKYGGPIPMLVESAYAIGAIDAPTYAAARDRLITTDHNAFYVADDTLTNRPPFGPTSLRMSEGRSEHAQMRHLLGESANEELCYTGPGVTSVGVHMLQYRGQHFDGTWNGQVPLMSGGPLRKHVPAWLADKPDLPTMEKVLGAFAAGGKGNEHAFAYASHPVSTIPWEDAKLESALKDFVREQDSSFPFKGMQVWNSRAARHHAGNKLYKHLDTLNPFVSRNWQRGMAFDDDVHGALVKHRGLMTKFNLYRLPLDPKVRLVRKHFIIGGSDSHGDFGYTVGQAATVILALLGTNDRTDDTLELTDAAYMKPRNYVVTDGFPEPRFMNALAHGSHVVTDGPVVWFEIDGDGRFDSSRGTFSATGSRFQNGEGLIGGRGAFDGGGTVLLANDARPLIRYSYNNYDEFGAPNLPSRDALGRTTQLDGTVETIAVYKTDANDTSFTAGTGHRMTADGSLDTHGGRAFGKVFTEALDVNEEGAVQDVSAIQLGAYTMADGDTSPADVYRCYTNPAWAVRVEVTAHIDPAKFAGGVIQPGGLKVSIASPISLRPDKLQLVLRALDARGEAAAVLATLEGDGWAEGVDAEGLPYSAGLFVASNRKPITLQGVQPYGPNGKATLVVMTKQAPRDFFGNRLNRIATTFEVDPATGEPGLHADADVVPQVSFPANATQPTDPDGAGFTETLQRQPR
jgi:hypothetical protein